MASSKNKASSSESKLPAPADDRANPELDEKLAAKADVAGPIVTDKPPPPDDGDDEEDELELDDEEDDEDLVVFTAK